MSRLSRPAVLIPLALAAVAAGAIAVPAATASDLAVDGFPQAPLNAETITTAALSFPTAGHPARLLVDGHQVAEASSGSLRFALSGLSDGRHTVVAEVERSFPRRTSRVSHVVVVDTTPPTLDVQTPKAAVKISDAVTVTGSVEPKATLTADGGKLAVTGTRFTVRYDRPPAGAHIVATDAAGNRTDRTVTVATRYPTNIRAVHVTGAAWAYSKLRDPVIALIKQKKINAVQLDIKDEDGVVNYRSDVALAKTVGSPFGYYELPKVTSYLHGLGVRVIGRIVAFNDPKLADYAVAHGHNDWVIQNPDGSKYLYGYNKHGFTNFANPVVRKYNQDLAVEAVKGGFDDVVYDYVRRPDGKIAGMRFPGLKVDPEDSIASFLQEAQAVVRPLGGSLGAAAFAQAATRPKSTAQNIPKMAKYLDVVIPMDYPSHWNPGEYGVADTYVGAYDIVFRSLKDWLKAVKGTNCVVVPWLQDENYKGRYTADKVRQQIKGARDNQIPGWLMWSAVARYTADAYSADAKPAR